MKTRLLVILTVLVSLILFSTTESDAQALSGNKVIGTGGDYTSLAAAITDLNTKGVSGTITLLINEDLTEPGSLEITSNTLNGNNKLVIKPNTGKTPTVTFTAVATSGNKGNSGIAVSGSASVVGNITIDGSNSLNGTTRDLTFALDDGTAGRYVLRFNGDTDDIIIKNLKIIGKARMATTSSGTRTYGVYAASSSTAAADNFVIHNCQIGSAESAFYYSIYKPDGGTFPYGKNINISNNTLFAQHKGLSVWGADGVSSINNNEVTVVGHPTGAYVQNSVNGIYAESWLGTINIFGNKIVSLKAVAKTQTVLRALYGIIVYNAGSPAGQTVNIYNNFISNFTYDGDATTEAAEVIGIAVDAPDQTVNVYFNTIYMSNLTVHPVYGIRVYDDVGQSANIKNNIVVNTVDQDNAYAIHVDPVTNNALKTCDYNDFVVTGANANIGLYNGTKAKTLANWRTASGKDANSISVNPANPFGGQGQLKGISDLHWVSKPVATFAGTPIAEILTDIDGETRNSSKPYMGADEGPALTSITRENSIPNEFVLNQNYPNPFNPETTISFSIKSNVPASLKIYDILGKEILTLIDGELIVGNYSVKFNAKNLASGIYFYKLNAGSFSDTKQMVLTK